MLFANIAFWLFCIITIFLMVNQLLYQEDSLVHCWYKSAPGYHVFVVMLVFWLFVGCVALAIYHQWSWAGPLFGLDLIWIIFFLLYNRAIEIDVQNRLGSGDFPDITPAA